MFLRACLFSLMLALPIAPAMADTVLIENAHVFDGRQDLGLTSLLIKDGKIAHVGAVSAARADGARRVDYRGKFVMPGLISDHSHVGNTQGIEHGDRFYTRENVLRDLRQFQRYGVTTVTSLGMNGAAFFAIRDEVKGDPRLGAQLFGAGGGIGAVDGAPPAKVMGLQNDPVARPATPEEAREAVRQQAKAGVDLLKLWVDDLGGKVPQMKPEIYRAVIDEAHKQHLKVAAHIHDMAPAADLVASGLDIIAHGMRDTSASPALITQMKQRGTWYIPTINIDEATYLYAEEPQRLQKAFLADALPSAVRKQWSDPAWRQRQLAGDNIPGARSGVAMNLRNLRALHEAGVRIGFGTDSGAMPNRVIGYAEHRELELMTQAGFTAAQALETATFSAAQLLSLDDRGHLAPGKRADLLVLEGDPLRDIRNTRRIAAVWQAGVEVSDAVMAGSD